MYGICDSCQYFIDLGEIEISCQMGHPVIADRSYCEDYSETQDETGDGAWSED